MATASGQRGSTNPTAMLASLVSKRERLQDELRVIEKQVYEMETNYLQDSSHFGNVLKGFEGFLSSSKNTTKLKNLELDGMMEDLILVKAGLRVEAYLRMDRGSQKREEQHQGMESELGHQVKLILTTKMIRI
ncbi:chromatin modification-related protein MEAF6 isoform X2 [Vitis riparia]|uniref:chromatin modification-related protein MEAF6 isoform X2 n=1 Tax=Vitis riparia TaxID=96939 RepID=UPI00155ADF6F|nr:chromatin modification-related protein MEAF6 isoform X2 [Vitis riparia]